MGKTAGRRAARRAGLATVDYVLILCVVFPMAAVVIWSSERIMRLAYEMVHTLITWPFM